MLADKSEKLVKLSVRGTGFTFGFILAGTLVWMRLGERRGIISDGTGEVG